VQSADNGKQWYDSVWLARFMEAQEVVARVAPHRLREFIASFDILRVPADFSQRIVRGFLGEEQLATVREEIRAIPLERLEVHEIKSFGRMIVHRWPAFTALQEQLVELVSELAGEPVEPSYNFLSLYTKMGVCETHLDAPSAKWTLDICIDQSEPWPIHFSKAIAWPVTPEQLRSATAETIVNDPTLEFEPAVLLPGDAVLFSGTNQWHYRDPLPPGPGKRFCDLLFLHYIPRGTAELVQPKNWARLFDIPELAELPELDQTY